MDSIFGRFQDASKKLKLMITLAPDNPEPYHLLGTMHEELGNYQFSQDNSIRQRNTCL
jgi:Flp pilus assembly protein TadD